MPIQIPRQRGFVDLLLRLERVPKKLAYRRVSTSACLASLSDPALRQKPASNGTGTKSTHRTASKGSRCSSPDELVRPTVVVSAQVSSQLGAGNAVYGHPGRRCLWFRNHTLPGSASALRRCGLRPPSARYSWWRYVVHAIRRLRSSFDPSAQTSGGSAVQNGDSGSPVRFKAALIWPTLLPIAGLVSAAPARTLEVVRFTATLGNKELRPGRSGAAPRARTTRRERR